MKFPCFDMVTVHLKQIGEYLDMILLVKSLLFCNLVYIGKIGRGVTHVQDVFLNNKKKPMLTVFVNVCFDDRYYITKFQNCILGLHT